MAIQVIHADSLEYLRTLPENSLHACITDPPYGLGVPPDPMEVLAHWAQFGDWKPKTKRGGFMGKEWDKFVPGPELWREVHRVLRPGAYLAAFAGTRTWDWMSLGIRFAGFRKVDTLMWLYGQGWNKGGDVGKRIDKKLGAKRTNQGPRGSQGCPWLKQGLDCKCSEGGENSQAGRTVHQPLTTPSTPEAAEWDDCTTGLKPAWEPILLFQKEWEGSNCLKWGTGAMRTGDCRIPTTPEDAAEDASKINYEGSRHWTPEPGSYSGKFRPEQRKPLDLSQGRVPTNILFSHLPECKEGACNEDCPVADLDRQSGFLHASGNKKTSRKASFSNATAHIFGQSLEGHIIQYDKGGASRFFYCAKTHPREKNVGLPEGLVNNHPTVKPQKLLQHLVRLLTPKGGTLLDPFAGSGSLGVAVVGEGNLSALLIEREADYHAIATARVDAALRRRGETLDESWFEGSDLDLDSQGSE